MKKVLMAAIVSAIILTLSVPGQAQIVNGDFETGVIAPATTDYNYIDPATLLKPPHLDLAQYTIDTSPANVHGAWADYGDHTSGSGNMLIVNATNVSGQTVWGQTVDVIAGAEYTFSYWLRGNYDADANLAQIQTSINTVVIGTATAQLPIADWVEVSYTWNSGSAILAAITLEEMVLAADGDDFSIDDISIELVPATIEKEMDDGGDGGDLGEHITVTLTVDNPYDDPVTVVDEIPDGLHYIPGTLVVGGSPATDPEDNTISVAVANGDDVVITFDVQVVEVQYEDVNTTNTAYVYAPGATDPEDDDSDSVEITLHPYPGLSKVVVDCNIIENGNSISHTPWDEVPWHTDVHWWIEITVEDVADEVVAMQNVVVKDNLGGDLELDSINDVVVDTPPKKMKKSDSEDEVENVTIQWSGESQKVHLSWDVTAAGGPDLTLTLEVSTDFNPGQKKKDPGVHGYTSLGEHDLNSGATLKFTDSGTGLQLSAHTAPITVTAVE